jgi:HK97 family phage major capsid protein
MDLEVSMTIAQQLGRVKAATEMSKKAREFCNLARIVAMSRNDDALAQHIAEESRLSPTIRSILSGRPAVYAIHPAAAASQKAAISAGTTIDSGWALPLSEYQVLAGAFLESLKNYGAFDAMLPSTRRVPFRTRIGASTTGITGTTVGQAQVKPISKLTLSGTQIDERKAVAILVVTDELVRFGDSAAGNLFSIELSNAVAVETDLQFVTVLSAGATSIGSSGVTAENVRNDLRAMLASVTTNARSALFLLVTSAIAKILAVLHDNTGGAAFPTLNVNGGSIAGIQVVVSDGVSANTMLLVDAQQVAAASETVQLAATREAIVAMDAAPDSPATASTVMTSLWQNNLTGLKAERFFGVQKLSSVGVCVLTGASYTGDSPGP